MKKHIFGLMLFSFIVSTAAIVYGFLNILFPVPNSVSVFEPQYAPAERAYYKMREKSEASSIEIKQAVFNTRTKSLSWELESSRAVEFPVLHLFVKDEKGARLLDSIDTVRYFTDADATKFSNQYLELSNVSSKTNLYLIPDTNASSAENETGRYDVMFDSAKAFPVTIDYGK